MKKLCLSVVIFFFYCFAGVAFAQSIYSAIYNQCMSSEGRGTPAPEDFQPNPQSYCSDVAEDQSFKLDNLMNNPPACYNSVVVSQAECKGKYSQSRYCEIQEAQAQECLSNYPSLKWIPL